MAGNFHVCVFLPKIENQLNLEQSLKLEQHAYYTLTITPFICCTLHPSGNNFSAIERNRWCQAGSVPGGAVTFCTPVSMCVRAWWTCYLVSSACQVF